MHSVIFGNTIHRAHEFLEIIAVLEKFVGVVCHLVHAVLKTDAVLLGVASYLGTCYLLGILAVAMEYIMKW